MANRPVFICKETKPFYREVDVDFEFYPGFSLKQKQRCIRSLHDSYRNIYGDRKLLEISSRSEEELGASLSAFHLMKYVPSLNRSVPVECVFQAGKIFENGGPYLDLMELDPKSARKDPRLHESGGVIAFEFEGKRFSNEPKTMFYDYIYISALEENYDLSDQLIFYDGFTDIEFNPERQLNCQARSCAIYLSLIRSGKLKEYLKSQGDVSLL